MSRLTIYYDTQSTLQRKKFSFIYFYIKLGLLVGTTRAYTVESVMLNILAPNLFLDWYNKCIHSNV